MVRDLGDQVGNVLFGVAVSVVARHGWTFNCVWSGMAEGWRNERPGSRPVVSAGPFRGWMAPEYNISPLRCCLVPALPRYNYAYLLGTLGGTKIARFCYFRKNNLDPHTFFVPTSLQNITRSLRMTIARELSQTCVWKLNTHHFAHFAFLEIQTTVSSV